MVSNMTGQDATKAPTALLARRNHGEAQVASTWNLEISGEKGLWDAIHVLYVATIAAKSRPRSQGCTEASPGTEKIAGIMSGTAAIGARRNMTTKNLERDALKKRRDFHQYVFHVASEIIHMDETALALVTAAICSNACTPSNDVLTTSLLAALPNGRMIFCCQP